MAGYDRFMIAPFTIGQETDLKPWMLPDEAFEKMSNAYVFRGRIKKRFGALLSSDADAGTEIAPLNSRGCIPLSGGPGVGETDGAGVANGTVPGALFLPGQQFSVEDVIFTVPSTGNPVNLLRTDASAEPATYDTTTGAYSITIAAYPNAQVYFYPAQPILGISQYEFGSVNNQQTFIFDTQFAYYFTGSFWSRSGTALWHGDNTNLYWITNWSGSTDDNVSMFVSNFYCVNYNGAVDASDDPVWTYDGSTWATYTPKLITADAGSTIATAKIIVPFKNRLVMLNVVETDAAGANNVHYHNRCRFSAHGSPFPANTAWLNPNQANYMGAGWIDAPTEEEIVSAGFIKDRLIVYFERSTWELVYTGNQILPFVWQKLNTELGSESLASTVAFDKDLLTVGGTGIHACNGSNVVRIDSKIPYEIFKIKNKEDGIGRVVGIRDFYNELVYWALPISTQAIDNIFPNKILVYNYTNGAWAFNDDTITAFGYFEQQVDYIWESMSMTWEEALFTWDSGVVQSQQRKILAGNQQGFVFKIEPDVSINAPVLSITSVSATSFFIENHNLEVGEFIRLENTGTDEIYKVIEVVDEREVILNVTPDPSYIGGGYATRVSRIDILSKQWNPYVGKGYDFHLAKIEFNVNKTENGYIYVEMFNSYSNEPMLEASRATGTRLGNGILETDPNYLTPFERVQSQLWHTLYFESVGSSAQIRIYWPDILMTDENAVFSAFELNGMILHTRPTSIRA